MSQHFGPRSQHDRRQLRTARRRRAILYGGDPYEDDVERVLPVPKPSSGARTARRSEGMDQKS